jgi:pimeloyl-ACP methyl ester carboxylesterase
VRELPNAQARHLPNAAHLPNLEDPAGFGRALATFVNSLPPP